MFTEMLNGKVNFHIFLQVCMLVFVCVVFTVINVCGFAQFIGLNIEIITSICLILSPGLALDYAAHIGVMYACLKDGSRKQKMRITLGLVKTRFSILFTNIRYS